MVDNVNARASTTIGNQAPSRLGSKRKRIEANALEDASGAAVDGEDAGEDAVDEYASDGDDETDADKPRRVQPPLISTSGMSQEQLAIFNAVKEAQQRNPESLLSNGIIVSGVPANIYTSYRSSRKPHRLHPWSRFHIKVPQWIDELRSVEVAKIQEALKKLHGNGVQAVGEVLGLTWDGEVVLLRRVLHLVAHCFENRSKGVAATHNATERTLDRDVWSKFFDLIDQPNILVRYGDTGSQAHHTQERGNSARLVDWSMTVKSSQDNRGIEIMTGESLGAAKAGPRDSKIRKSARTAQDTSSDLFERSANFQGKITNPYTVHDDKEMITAIVEGAVQMLELQ
ncbi:hypothetical protein HK104_005741, partial [Borealophlyctis nickersoniae]